MKRVLTATCLAASFAVGLAAQSTTTAGTTGTAGTAAQDPQGGQRGGGPRTITGCLRAGDTAGTFMLTDVQGLGGGRGQGGGAAGGTTAGTATTGGGATGGTTQGGPPMSINLTADSSVDLKANVGKKVEVTGTIAGGGRRAGDAGTTGTATGTTAGTTTGSTGAAGTATATGTGSTSGTGTAGATGTGQGGGRGPRSMTVTSVRMVSESCS